jgi:aspartyl-tRNA(Asn)/glutamyl-tRNA(Gln) amidotransferase subunit C
MAIGQKDVEHIASLARLSLSEEEKSGLEKDLNAILGYMEALNTLDTKGVEPTSHTLEITNAFREDELVPFEKKEAIIKNAPASEGAHFQVPPIAEEVSST